jgi:hypothetical protein
VPMLGGDFRWKSGMKSTQTLYIFQCERSKDVAFQ